MFTASLLSRFMQNPIRIHMGTDKRVLRQGTLDYGIKYDMRKSAILIGFVTVIGEAVKMIAEAHCVCFTFGSGVFSWASVK